MNQLRSRVAVKAVNSAGLGQYIKGTIEDNEGNVITEFATQHLGMGVFTLTPQKGKSYKAKIVVDQSTFNVELPNAVDKGFTLSINNSDADSVFFRLAASEAAFKEKQNTVFYIVAQSGGKVYYTAASQLVKRSYSAAIDKKRFPTGVLEFTLFSANGEPLNARTVFIRNSDTLNLQVSSTAKTYTTAQKVTIAFDAKNEKNQKVMGAFSASVTNENLAPTDENRESTILNNLLLTSDLKGKIEQPNYYFINNNEQTNADMDALMLTQGYQRFVWKEILTDTVPLNIYQAEQLLALRGTINRPSGKPVPYGKLTVIATKEKLLLDTITDSNGNFKFADLDLPDLTKIIVNGKKANNGDNVRVSIKPEDIPPFIRRSAGNLAVTYKSDRLPLSRDIDSVYIQQRNALLKNRHQLKEVVIKSKKRYWRKDPRLTDSLIAEGSIQAYQVISGDDLNKSLSLSQALGQVINSVDIIGGVPYRYYRGKRVEMTLIINEVTQRDNAYILDSIDPAGIESVLLFTDGPAPIKYEVRSNLIVIKTKPGGAQYASPGNLQYTFHGFYKAHEFYSPRYDTPVVNKQSDLRSTIYWNPNILTDKDGKASFEYFNADTKGTYRVVIEGIDDDGNLGRAVYRYKVD